MRAATIIVTTNFDAKGYDIEIFEGVYGVGIEEDQKNGHIGLRYRHTSARKENMSEALREIAKLIDSKNNNALQKLINTQ